MDRVHSGINTAGTSRLPLAAGVGLGFAPGRVGIHPHRRRRRRIVSPCSVCICIAIGILSIQFGQIQPGELAHISGLGEHVAILLEAPCLPLDLLQDVGRAPDIALAKGVPVGPQRRRQVQRQRGQVGPVAAGLVQGGGRFVAGLVWLLVVLLVLFGPRRLRRR